MNAKILFVGADPHPYNGLRPYPRLDLDAEVREIERALPAPSFTLVSGEATHGELLRQLREVNPDIVHFYYAGHGCWDASRDIPSMDRPAPQLPFDLHPHIDDPQHGLALLDRDGQPTLVSPDALAQMFDAADNPVRLVVLNACHSGPLAKALVSHVDCAIGMDGTLDERAARSFSARLYGALGDGESIAAAFRRACAAVEGMCDDAQPQMAVRDGMDASQLVLAENHPARTGPTLEAMLDAFTVRAPPDELRPIMYFLGECVARRQMSTLAKFHARARQLRQASEPGSWHRGFADSLTAYLDGYFAEVEPAKQREQLAREVAECPLWREILYALRDDPALNQVAIRERVGAHAPGVASSKSAISVALEDLRVRELVEYVPGEVDRRERIHSLTLRGRELLADPVLASALTHTVRDDTRAHSTMGSSVSAGQRSPGSPATSSQRPRQAPTQASPEGDTRKLYSAKRIISRGKRRLSSDPL